MDTQKHQVNFVVDRIGNAAANKLKNEQRISDFDFTLISKNDDGSLYSGSGYQYKNSLGLEKGESFFQRNDEVTENPRTVKFVSGLKDDKVENKLSSLFSVDKDMIQMPVINLPSSNKYGIQEDIHFQKEDLSIDQQKVWMNLTKDILNPFVPSLRPLVSKQTDFEKVIEQDQMKFKNLNPKTGPAEKLLKQIAMAPAQHSTHQKKKEHRASNSLDHYFQYFTKDLKINTNNTQQFLNSNQQSHHPSLLSKFQAQQNDNQIRSKKPSQVQMTNSQKKLIKNSPQVTSLAKPPANVTPFLPLQDEDNNQEVKSKIQRIEQFRNAQSPRNSQNLQATSPSNQEGVQQRQKKLPSTFGQAASQTNRQDGDVFDILDRRYRKKYNMEYKMQLRRKSCCCALCGPCTNYENKYQNIVNPILVRKRKRFTKVFKVVNFLNIMNRTTMKQIPSNQEIEESQPSVPNNPSLQENSESNIQQGSSKNIALPIPNQSKAVKMDPPSLSKIELNNINEESPVRRSHKLLTQKLVSPHQEEFRKPSHNRIRKSFTLHVDDDISKIKNEMMHEYDNSDYSPHHYDDDEDDSVDRQQQSFAMEINSDQDISLTYKRHKVADKRSKGKKLSYIQQKSSFLNFIEKKIQEAKKKRMEDEIKYVGKTPLTLLLQILSKGKRNSVFNSTEYQDKKLQQFIVHRKPHTSIHRERNHIQNENQNPDSNSEFSSNEKGGFGKNLNNQTSSSQLSNRNGNHCGDENMSEDINQFHSARKTINSPPQMAQHIPPLALFKRKVNKKEVSLSQRERGFVISPAGMRTFDQINCNTSSSKSQNGFVSIKKQMIESALNPLKIVKKQIKETKEKDPYLQQSQMQPELQKVSSKKILFIREKKLNSDCSSNNNHYMNMASYSTLRQTNTAQTTDRSSILSNSNKKLRPDSIRENRTVTRNRLQTSSSKSNLNRTDFHTQKEQNPNSLTVDNNSLSQSYFFSKNQQHSSSANKMISPRFKQLLEDSSLKNKVNPYIKQMFQTQRLPTKSPEFFPSTTNNQLSQTKSLKLFKSAKTHRQ